MCPMILNRLSDGPAMSLLDTPGSFSSYPAHPGSAFAGKGSFQPALSSSLSETPAPPKPSRKRSRDEAAFEEILAAPARPEAQPAPAPKEEPIYGEGMVLLNPQTGMAISAESQTGTWYEETAESQQVAAAPVSSRSIALHTDAADLSRKAQRLDTSAPGLDDIALSSINQRLNGPDMADQHRSLSGGSTPPAEPLIDDATRLLGISWQRLDTDNDMAPAVRGWTKYIDNQYAAHLRGSQMLMKSRALNAYLVAATPVSAFSPAFYLFNEDLTQAQLVASSWETCLHNLRCTPLVFEGATPLAAASRPQPAANPFSTIVEPGVPLLQQALSSHSHSPITGIDTGVELNGGVGMGMEIDS
ncbi:hypothetical protein N7462_002263 [Penicillium macrosclerotiorum]|uniref:uncharacterized protein n=1 Tax=Penicillium macrosclerotiorum TaxID=303699 RepID=UPI002547627A|nr:uncharacterized protein N7462_002263 [Penicillium macrosclerotiorum]KAJ5692840.1 hypothetical protein N7462_002263 [Penicillium macrosclerotiorum]